MTQFSGAGFDPIRDTERLKTQIDCLRTLALDGEWRTVQKLAEDLRAAHPGIGFPKTSVSAQLRNLRKEHFRVERRHVKNGLHEYRVLPPEPSQTGHLFSEYVKNACSGAQPGSH